MKPEEHRKLVLENIDNLDPTDRQIIDLLLLLLDDWEVRAAVMKCIRRREELEKAQAQGNMKQTVISSGQSNGNKT
jgi:hypothetical protein